MTGQARSALLSAELVAKLAAAGTLDDTWRPVFEAVPRQLFVPDTIWRLDPDAGGRLVPLHRAEDPDRWLALVYRDRPVDTQVDDGHPAADGTGWEVTSSASQPTVVADMLRALDPAPGMRVLEIGTGTGWNAALLAARVGAENVVSVEVDAVVAERARAALDAAGYGQVTVVTGDGADGCPDRAPFDRVLATVGVSEVPYSWVAQTRSGGRVVVPLSNTYQAPGIAVLDVAGGVASGYLGAPAVFMGLRAQRVPRPRGVRPGGGAAEDVSSTEVHPYCWAGDRAAATAIGQRVEGVHAHFEAATADTGTQWLFDPVTDSWASVDLDGGPPPYRVEQGGPRRVFDEVIAAYRWWLDAGSPPLSQWLVTVSTNGQSMTLNATSTLRAISAAGMAS
ncbi:MAG: methyltransferase domain-containing protein [Pseudonocardia sp.]